jgi:outer membrane lipoprotein
MMKNRFRLFLLLFLTVLLSGCAHVISKDLREKADTALTFQQVLQDPNAYIDKYALWGGEIIQTINQKDGTTLIEVFQRPLGSGEEPKLTQASDGRFLALAEKYLDPYLFRRGRKVTVAGKILGSKTRPLGETDYRYPLLSGEQVYLWEEYYYPAYYPYYPYSSYYPYYPYYPYYYYPWWRPYWWGPSWWGFGYRYYR